MRDDHEIIFVLLERREANTSEHSGMPRGGTAAPTSSFIFQSVQTGSAQNGEFKHWKEQPSLAVGR